MPELKRGRMSPEEEARVLQLGERGLSSGRVAQLLNRHHSTINWAFYRLGLKAPGPARGKCYVRNGRTVRQFTAEEDSYIETLRIAGHSRSAIARAANARFGTERSYHAIHMRLVMLANREGADG